MGSLPLFSLPPEVRSAVSASGSASVINPKVAETGREVDTAARAVGNRIADRYQSLQTKLLVLQFNKDGTSNFCDMRRAELLKAARAPSYELHDFLVTNWDCFRSARDALRKARRKNKGPEGREGGARGEVNPVRGEGGRPAAQTWRAPPEAPLPASAFPLPSLHAIQAGVMVSPHALRPSPLETELAVQGSRRRRGRGFSGSDAARAPASPSLRSIGSRGPAGAPLLDLGRGDSVPGGLHPAGRSRDQAVKAALRAALAGTLQARDVRKLDPTFSRSAEPSLLVRRHAILFGMSALKALVLHDRCFVVVPDGADSLLSVLMTRLRAPDRGDSDLPFEFRALEALLTTLCMVLESELEQLRPLVADALGALQRGARVHQLEQLRLRKQRVDAFTTQLERIQRELADTLDNDEELSRMRLTLTLHAQRARQRLWLCSADALGVDTSSPPAAAAGAESGAGGGAGKAVGGGSVGEVPQTGSEDAAAEPVGRSDEGAEGAAGAAGAVSPLQVRVEEKGDGSGGAGSAAEAKAGADALEALGAPDGGAEAITLDQLPGHVEVEDVELLMESYLQEVEEVCTKATLMTKEIAASESLMMMRLDDTRNRVLKVELWFSVIATVLGPCTLVSGVFGMNLKNHREDNENWFGSVLVGMAIFSAVGFVALAAVLKRMGVLDA